MISRLMVALICWPTAAGMILAGTGRTELHCRVLEPEYVQCERAVSLLYHLIRPAPERFRLTDVEIREEERTDDDGDRYYRYEVYLLNATAQAHKLGTFTTESQAAIHQRALRDRLSGATTADFAYEDGGALQALLMTVMAVGIAAVGVGAVRSNLP